MAASLPDGAAEAPPNAVIVRRLAVPATGLLLVILGLTAGLLIGSRRALPRDDSAEAGFARDMATHHAQAVDMSFVVRDKSRDEELRTLASDIIVTQSSQRGIFMGWLQQWGLPQASARPRMSWMPGHAHLSPPSDAGLLMHGMASEAELRRLRDANGVDAEILFLQLMIRHHEGGIVMARALLALSDRRELVVMANSIDAGQRAEINHMKTMLSARGARPFTSLVE
jgi:uncharacterized protein (DUF305 family)